MEKDPTDTEQIIALETAALARWGRGDPSGFLEISAPEVTYFDHATEQRLDGWPVLSELYEACRGKIHIRESQLLNPCVQVHGDAAVLTYNFQSVGSEGPKRWNCTEVYARLGRAWRIVHTHWALTAHGFHDARQNPLLEALRAEGPAPELADQLGLFGQFVGSWDLDVVYHFPDGTQRRLEGEWHFGWALEGRAIQDVWVTPRRSRRDPAQSGPVGDYGATLRFFDPSIGAWRSTWIGPMRRVVMPFIGRAAGSEIVLEGSFEPGVSSRWIFSHIKPESFLWRSVESRDGWKTLQLKQEMSARRRS